MFQISTKNKLLSDVHKLPPAKGPREIWQLRFANDYNLLVTEAGIGIEAKLSTYLNFFLISKFNPSKTQKYKLDSIGIEAIPVESDPIGFLRSHPDVGSFEAVINASAFKKKSYGAFADLLDGLNPTEEKLVLKVSLKTQKRGGDLPEILLSNLANFLEKIGVDDLTQARASEIDDGKKMRPTRILGALQHKKKWIKDDEKEKTKELNNYVNSLMLSIGDIIKIKEE